MADEPFNVGEALNQFMDKKHLHARYAAIQKEVFEQPDIQDFFQTHKDELSRELVNRDFSVLYEYYTQQKNAAAGKPVVHT